MNNEFKTVRKVMLSTGFTYYHPIFPGVHEENYDTVLLWQMFVLRFESHTTSNRSEKGVSLTFCAIN